MTKGRIAAVDLEKKLGLAYDAWRSEASGITDPAVLYGLAVPHLSSFKGLQKSKIQPYADSLAARVLNEPSGPFLSALVNETNVAYLIGDFGCDFMAYKLAPGKVVVALENSSVSNLGFGASGAVVSFQKQDHCLGQAASDGFFASMPGSSVILAGFGSRNSAFVLMGSSSDVGSMSSGGVYAISGQAEFAGIRSDSVFIVLGSLNRAGQHSDGFFLNIGHINDLGGNVNEGRCVINLGRYSSGYVHLPGLPGIGFDHLKDKEAMRVLSPDLSDIEGYLRPFKNWPNYAPAQIIPAVRHFDPSYFVFPLKMHAGRLRALALAYRGILAEKK